MRAIEACGFAGEKATDERYEKIGGHSDARPDGGADRSRRDRRLGAGAGTFRRARRAAAARTCSRSRRCAKRARASPSRPRRARSQPRDARRSHRRAGFPRGVSIPMANRRRPAPAQAAQARRHARRISAAPGSTTSTAAISRARSPPISRSSARRSPAPTSRPIARAGASRCRSGLEGATLYNTPAPDPGARLADDPRDLRAAGGRASRRLRSRARPDRGGQARLRPSATASASISISPPRISAAAVAGFLQAEAAAHRQAPRGALAAAAGDRATRSGWAPSTRDGLAVSYIQSVYWEYGSGFVWPRTGVTDAEPRHRLLARSPPRPAR